MGSVTFDPILNLLKTMYKKKSWGTELVNEPWFRETVFGPKVAIIVDLSNESNDNKQWDRIQYLDVSISCEISFDAAPSGGQRSSIGRLPKPVSSSAAKLGIMFPESTNEAIVSGCESSHSPRSKAKTLSIVPLRSKLRSTLKQNLRSFVHMITSGQRRYSSPDFQVILRGLRAWTGARFSDEGPMLETLDYTIRIGSTPTFLKFGC